MARLGDVCSIVSGTTPKSGVAEYWNGELDWITPAELNDDSYVINESERKITELGAKKAGLTPFPAGTVILSSRAPIGKVAIAGKSMYCNQGFKNLICSDVILNSYLFWFLKGKTAFLNSLGRGATFKEISKSIVEQIEIPLPKIGLQQKIADKFDLLCRLISLRKQQLSKLDELVKSQFVEMFGDPNHINSNVSTVPMTEVCEIIDGDRGKNYPNQDEFFEDGYCLFLNAKNVTANGFVFDSCMYISAEKDKALRKGKLSRGDVVLTTRGTLGNLAYYDDTVPYEHVRINSGMVILRMKHKEISERFFIEQFKQKLEIIKQSVASGTAQPQLPISSMNKICIILPPIELQKNYVAYITRIDKCKLAVQQSLDKLETLKKALMQKYFG